MIGLAGFSRAACQLINFSRSWHHIHSLSICWEEEKEMKENKKRTFLVYCSFFLFVLSGSWLHVLKPLPSLFFALRVFPFSATEPENKQLAVCSVIGHPSGISSNSHSTRTRHGRLPICHLDFLWYRYVSHTCTYMTGQNQSGLSDILGWK